MMPRKSSKRSITNQVSRSAWFIMIVLLVPAIISLAMMLFYSAYYQKSIGRMETIADLKPTIGIQIPEKVWRAISGYETFEDTGVDDLVDFVNRTLEELTLEEPESIRLQLVIARRTMDTMHQYIQQIRTNIHDRIPVYKSEQTLEEVRNVAELITSMLDENIAGRISLSKRDNSRMRYIVLFSAGIEILLLLFAFLQASKGKRRLMTYIQDPIAKLEHFASLVADGDLHARIPPMDFEELENLTGAINTMAARLEKLMAQSKQEQENLRKAELRTLQAQINPHFLYNTLDTIVWQAEAGHVSDIISLTRSLSDFFRISLSSGKDWIPLSQEIRHLTGYLSIQRTRYRDILDYVIDVPENLRNIVVLKLLLQPIVENALYHGIKAKRGGGTITVQGRQEGERLFFSVRDTGAGMSPDRLQEIVDHLHHGQEVSPMENHGSGFGLFNVDQRIRLYYQQSEGLHIESGPDGTVVSFTIPVRAQKEDQV